MELTEQQIDYLDQQIRERGIEMPSLAEDLLDHFACAVEREMEAGKAFEDAFNKVYLEISPDGLKEIQDQTKYLLTLNRQLIMKKVVFIVGFITALIYVIGTIFKIMHWPTANILIMTGASLFGLAFLPMYYISKYNWDKKSGRKVNLPVMVVNFAFWFLVVVTVVFKHLHWPGAGPMGVVSLLAMGFILLPQVFKEWYRRNAV